MRQIVPRDRDLGDGFHVRRVLPSANAPAVGPFVFMDHFGPVEVNSSRHFDVRPHPHIGLATVTYLFEGALMHRDSLGSVQRIEPGAINWMSAGRGIVHSERTPDDLRAVAHMMHGLQLWVGLPETAEEGDPTFNHTPAQEIPAGTLPGAEFRVLLGGAFGRHSPVPTASATLFVILTLLPGSELLLPRLAEETGIYALDPGATLDGISLETHTLSVPEDTAARLASRTGARLAIIGGAPLGARFLWWNFVSSDRARIESAARRWADGGFVRVPGDNEFIPLPEMPRIPS